MYGAYVIEYVHVYHMVHTVRTRRCHTKQGIIYQGLDGTMVPGTMMVLNIAKVRCVRTRYGHVYVLEYVPVVPMVPWCVHVYVHMYVPVLQYSTMVRTRVRTYTDVYVYTCTMVP